MQLLAMFNTSAEKALATSLSNQLVSGISPSLMKEKRTALSVNKITRLLEKTYQLAREYQIAQRLGYFRRVALINAFKWELEQQGYPEDFVHTAVEGLIVALAARK